MTPRETVRILAAVRSLWPSFCRGCAPAELSGVAESWHGLLAAEEYETVRRAVLELAAEDVRGYPPAAGAVLARARRLRPGRREPPPRYFPWADVERMRRYYAALGLPGPAEAKKRGMSYSEWRRALLLAEETARASGGPSLPGPPD